MEEGWILLKPNTRSKSDDEYLNREGVWTPCSKGVVGFVTEESRPHRRRIKPRVKARSWEAKIPVHRKTGEYLTAEKWIGMVEKELDQIELVHVRITEVLK
jgi:hypothetical protein